MQKQLSSYWKLFWLHSQKTRMQLHKLYTNCGLHWFCLCNESNPPQCCCSFWSELILTFTSFLVYKLDHIQNLIFYVLANSSSTYFIIITFAYEYSILTTPTLSVELKLFDRSLNNFISETASLFVTFSSGHWMILNVCIRNYFSQFLLFVGIQIQLAHSTQSIDWFYYWVHHFVIKFKKKNSPPRKISSIHISCRISAHV